MLCFDLYLKNTCYSMLRLKEYTIVKCLQQSRLMRQNVKDNASSIHCLVGLLNWATTHHYTSGLLDYTCRRHPQRDLKCDAILVKSLPDLLNSILAQ